MLSAFLFFALADGASCGLGAIDPDDVCEVKNGWGTFNADAYSNGQISLSIEMKLAAHKDRHGVEHPATVSTLSPNTGGRHILACKQAEDMKTVKFVVSRPKELTEFGGEWVKLFRKDSWENITNEYEPFTFNKFGGKIPLFRETTTGKAEDAVTEDELVVYMEVSEIGDYEVKYGNPKIVSTYDGEERWVAVEFKSTLLRVGSPWAECSGDAVPEADKYENIGTIIPAFYGKPNPNLKKYMDLAESLEGASVPVKVVLQIFTVDTKLYSMSEKDATKTLHSKGEYEQCYMLGNPCPENHRVCKPEYCEMDTWEEIIRTLKENAFVTVLGAVGEGTLASEYDILDAKVDGFYFLDGQMETVAGDTVNAIGQPLMDKTKVNDVATYVTLAFDELGIFSPYAWYPYTDATKWSAIVDSVALEDVESTVGNLFDRGYGYVFLTDHDGYDAPSSYTPQLLNAIATVKAGGAVRRLEDRQTATYSWGCDDTLLECSPICLAQAGPVTTIAHKAKCAGEPVDPCKCECQYDAEWKCEKANYRRQTADGGEGAFTPVCVATRKLERMVVGDLVCLNRGSPKPECVSEKSEKTIRGTWPTDQCLANWAIAAEAEAEEEREEVILTMTDSISAVTAFVLVALAA